VRRFRIVSEHQQIPSLIDKKSFPRRREFHVTEGDRQALSYVMKRNANLRRKLKLEPALFRFSSPEKKPSVVVGGRRKSINVNMPHGCLMDAWPRRFRFVKQERMR
jgi:hypothetical protein